ncbi:ATP phosphoribosyltransferase regulatory subunit [Bacillaceae bacterium S4-13-58]
MKKQMFEKPLGMRDTLPELYQQKERVRNVLSEQLGSWGYHYLDTPILEYYETVGGASAIQDQQLFKLLDQQGHTLVMRPDMTAPIARVAASRLKDQPMPYRLAYAGPVFRAQQFEGGRPAQFEQVGIELIGDPSIYGDGEVIALLAKSLEKIGLPAYQITVGHIGFVRGLLDEVFPEDKEIIEKFIHLLHRKNRVGFEELLEHQSINQQDKDRILQLLTLKGNGDLIDRARQVALSNEKMVEALEELGALKGVLKGYEVTDVMEYDLTLVSHMSYYTGILFEGYAPGLGGLICNGGRYDQLLPAFQSNTSATGFAIHLDDVIEALGQQESQEKPEVLYFKNQQEFLKAVKTAEQSRSEGKRVIIQRKGEDHE